MIVVDSKDPLLIVCATAPKMLSRDAAVFENAVSIFTAVIPAASFVPENVLPKDKKVVSAVFVQRRQVSKKFY